MPNLPTTWINDPVLYDRAVNAFPGDTPAEKVAAYRRAHNEWLKGYVIEVETQQIVQENQQKVRAKRAELDAIQFE